MTLRGREKLEDSLEGTYILLVVYARSDVVAALRVSPRDHSAGYADDKILTRSDNLLRLGQAQCHG